jgi:hypothetical protein
MAKTRKLSPALKAWNVHWKKVRAEMEKKGTFKKGDNLTKVFKEAKKSFKSHKKGGADEKPEEPEASPDAGPSYLAKPDEASPMGGRGKRKTRRGKGRMY